MSASNMSTSHASAVATSNRNLPRPRIHSIPGSNPSRAFPTRQHPSSGSQLRPSWSIREVNQPEDKQQDSATAENMVRGPRYEQAPKRAHRPRTSKDEQQVYVLTLKTTASISEPINEMRERYFPKHLNRISAHLTLFHALPHSELERIQVDLDSIASYLKPFRISTGRPFRMSRGVAIGLEFGARDSQALHDGLKETWREWLSDQDCGEWRPHWTVMNKVNEAKKVQHAFNTIRRDLYENVQEGRAIGLDLWKYEKGGWEWLRTFDFSGKKKAPQGDFCVLGANEQNNSNLAKTPGPWEGEGYFELDSRPDSEKNLVKSPGLWKKGIGYAKEKSEKGNERVASLWRSMGVWRGRRGDHEW